MTPLQTKILNTIIRELCIFYRLPKYFNEGLEKTEENMRELIEEGIVTILLEDDHFKFAVQIGEELVEL